MLTERSREDIIEEMLALRNSCHYFTGKINDLTKKIDDLTKINLQLLTELAQSETLLDVCVSRIQSLEKK